MKAHVIQKYRSSEQANARVRELETQIGLKGGSEIIDITEAWGRIELLERFTEAYPNGLSATTCPSPFVSPSKTQPKQSTPVTGLSRAIAANQSYSRKNHYDL